MANLVCKNLVKQYGAKRALDDVSLELEQGKIYGLIGRNGAGKTTLLAAVTAQNPLTSGQVLLGDLPVWENKKALASLCFARELNITSQNPIASLRVREYIETAAAYLPNWDAQMAAKLLAAFELEGKKRLNALSKGMLSMLTITVALASKAPFTFLDEPVAGLDVIARGDFYRLLVEEYAQSGRTFVISTHIIEEAADVLEEIFIMDRGRMIRHENTRQFVQSAFEVSGEASAVQRVCAGLESYTILSAGRKKTAAVFLREGQRLDEREEVDIAPMHLQDAFAALCGGEVRE